MARVAREALGTRVNPDTIVFVWTVKFDLNTLRVDGDFFESGKKKLRIQKYRIRVDGALDNLISFSVIYRVTLRNNRDMLN